jgi:Tfp pilus assembly protein PilN
MKAVNLIPTDERRGGGGAAGRSGGLVYVVLGGLAAFVVLAGLWVAAGRQVDDRRTQLAQVKSQADAAQAKADELAAYSRFATVAESRLQTVQQLASSRFDWSHTLREIGRVVPSDVALESLEGTVAPAATGQPAAQTGTAAGGPTLKIAGCTPERHESVARLMARLRQIDGVQGVSLESSSKGGAAQGDAAAAAGGGAAKGCTPRGTGAPTFAITLTFGAVPVDPKTAAGVTGSTTTVNAGSQP